MDAERNIFEGLKIIAPYLAGYVVITTGLFYLFLQQQIHPFAALGITIGFWGMAVSIIRNSPKMPGKTIALTSFHVGLGSCLFAYALALTIG